MKRKPSVKPPKSKRPAKVRAGKGSPMYAWGRAYVDGSFMWACSDHQTALYLAGFGGASECTIVPGRIGIDFTITPKARPARGK